MSLCIDDRFITGLFAFGQWFNVKKGSVGIDAYEFRYWEENPEPGEGAGDCHCTDYSMGAQYVAEYAGGAYGEHSKGRWSNPSGHTGICFTDTDTNERVSFSLLEVKAFREMRP